MIKYIVKRILILIPIMLAVSFIVYGILYLTPSDPARLMLGASAPDSALEQLRNELGLNDPFLVQYANYMKGVLHGDFGISYRSQQSVFLEIEARLPVTIKLAFSSIIVIAVLGILLGVISAVKQYSFVDKFLTVFSMCAASIPSFWLGLMLMLLFSLKLGLLPSYGVNSGWKSYIMPVIALSLPSLAEIIRMTRSAMLDTIHQDYVRTARAKGMQEKRVIFGQALKNALMPVITVIGANFGSLLGGSVVIETVFALPGLGNMVVSSIRTKDVPQVMAGTMVIAFMFCVILLIMDVAYAFIDPRIRTNYIKTKNKKSVKKNVEVRGS
jgi:peptide/nickel transport system permease protein